jgi:predicted negative regulator of RcsB-dependent stress response
MKDGCQNSFSKWESIRIILAIAAYFNYEIWQVDVKTTFLNGNLTEDVYMTQPEGSTFKSIRTILAIAAYLDYEIWQMDVKTVS